MIHAIHEHKRIAAPTAASADLGFSASQAVGRASRVVVRSPGGFRTATSRPAEHRALGALHWGSVLIGAAMVGVAVLAIGLRAAGTGLGVTWPIVVWAGTAVAGGLLLAFARSRTARASTATTTLGPYTLGAIVGEGAMGIVYRARHAFLPRPTAVKVLKRAISNPRTIARFEREVRMTSVLTHPNTIALYDCGRTPNGTFYYAMEYLDGLDLQQLVERHGPQDPARVAHLLAQACGSLAEAHGMGVIHRDLKPANVMLCKRGGMQDVIKVLDFGLSADRDHRWEDTTYTETGAIVGTPFYLSPEALTAPDTIDGRSDLYALGALGYFLLTGAPPFTGNGLIEVCARHLHATPVPLSLRVASPIPHELEALIMSCLEKTPERRPASAAAMQAALLPLAAEWTRERAARVKPDASR